MKPNASTKSWNSSSRCSFPSTTDQPSGASLMGTNLRDDLHGGADAGEGDEGGDVLVGHADAAVADVLPDELGVVRAVDRDLAGTPAEGLEDVREAGDAQLVRAVRAALVVEVHDHVDVEAAERRRRAGAADRDRRLEEHLVARALVHGE